MHLTASPNLCIPPPWRALPHRPSRTSLAKPCCAFFLRLSLLLACALGPSSPLPVLAQPDIIISEDTDWRYLKGVTEASSPDPAAWRLRDFNDASWSRGPGPFFYEDTSGFSGNTALTDMRGQYTCVFLRKSFTIADPNSVQELEVHVQADDGAIVWLNGTEVGRVNMPDGNPAYSWTSLPASGEPNTATFVITNAAPLLRAGANVLAVQAFNASLSDSSDFLIATSMTGNLDAVAPTIDTTVPPPGAQIRTLNTIEVVFTENVTGVDHADLLIQGNPAASLTIVSPRDYVFSFPQPASGAVSVNWAASHGIQDASGNPFSGAGWTYTLDPSAPLEDLIISEFMADNSNGIRDDFGARSDWIEIFNRSDVPADLDGWFLTDDAAALTKWRFPAVTLGARSYLRVWASGENQVNPLAPLHTNFRLSPSGEYLALVSPQTNVVSAFAPTYPPQQPDISFGRDVNSPESVGYFTTPTPGGPNSTSGSGFAPAVTFSITGGVFTNAPLSVTLSAPSGTIRYTTDGSRPTTSSPIYAGPIAVSRSMVVHARVFQTGLLPGPIGLEVYTLLGASTATFSSNLPLLILHTSGRAISAEARTVAAVTAIDTFRGRASLTSPASFMGDCQVEYRGQSSLGFPKKALNLEINDAQGNDLEVPLLGLPAESDWVLYNPYSDKPFLQNFLAYELHEKMGHYAPRCRFIELFVDTSGTSGNRLESPTDYQGIYILIEKIKVDGKRVDIARLTPEQNAEPQITGGYMIKKDKDSPGDRNFTTQGGAGFSAQALKIHEPKPREITSAQLTWIRNYVIQFEKALYAPNWLSATGTNHYSHYIDVDSFVDNHWIVEFPKQIDGYRLSNYMHKDRGGKLAMDPIWDWNLSFGNADYLDGAYTSGWYYTLLDENSHIWLRRLICGSTSSAGTSGDPDFNQRIADRWSVLRTNILNSTNLLLRIDELAAYLDEAQVRDFAKWPRLGTYIWPNPPLYSTPTTYSGIIANLKNWVRNRFIWIDSQFLRVPEFSLPGGGVSPGYPLTLTTTSGSIYYTTDGSDPRAPGGGISPQARLYGGGIRLDSNSRVVARARSGARWSGPAAATFTLDLPPLVLTELMYAPGRTPGSPTDDSFRFEFLELMNAGATPLDLRGFRFTRGIAFTFGLTEPTSLAPGARLVLARDPAALVQRHGPITHLAGPYEGSLDNQGERLTLVGPRDEVVLDLEYKPNWHPATDELGFALVPVTEGQPISAFAAASGWRPGALGGTPGLPDPAAPNLPRVVINEVLTHTDPPLVTMFELFNPGPTEADLSGWFLSDDRRTPKFRIPDGTTVPAGGFVVFSEPQFNPTPGIPPSFSLSAAGDEAYLYSADRQGQLTGYVQGYDFGAALNGVAFGRHRTSTGAEHFVAQAARTPGATNSLPAVGPIIISEIMYHPPDVFLNNAYWDNTEHEYIELRNLSPITVPLFDPNAPTNTWRLRDAVSFAFPTNQTMNPNERLLVVSFDPVANPSMANAFRSRYGLNANTRLHGPFTGKLSNSGNSVELIQPDVVRFYDTNYLVTSVLIDRVNYRDDAPWPAGADGYGYSLQRQTESAYGNDPTNWVAAAPTPATALGAATEPTITTHPLSQHALPGAQVTLSVEATGPAPLSYRWRFNGSPLPGAVQKTLLLTNAQPAQSGRYEAVVSTPLRALTSTAAQVLIAVPPTILSPPSPAQVDPGATVTFTTIAAGSTPLQYQWRRNGLPIPGATRSSFTLTNVTHDLEGAYDVVVSESSGLSSTSPAASLDVVGNPLDSDQDGLPDAWEIQFGLDPKNPNDASLDADADGATNLEEYLAGTHPRDPDSVLKIGELDLASGVIIRFQCLANRSYTLQYREAASGGLWHRLADIPALPGGGDVPRTVEIADPAGHADGQRYYRLVTPAAP